MARQNFHGRENAGEKGGVRGNTMRHTARKMNSIDEVNKPRAAKMNRNGLI